MIGSRQSVAFCLILLAGLILSSARPLEAQNLVPDPGFEIWDGTVGIPPATLSPLTDWYEANGTPDHHHQDNPPGNNLTSLEPCATGNGQTQCGTPHGGKGVLGCWKGNGPDGRKEWAGTELLDPLIPGACYHVSFWFQNKEDDPAHLMLTNQWGVFFATSALPAFNPDLASFAGKTGQFLATTEVNDGSDWSFAEFTYTPTQAYSHVYVGYMGDVSTSTYTAWSNDFMIGFYAWFDDLVIERIDPQLSVIPDPVLCLGDSILLTATANFPVEWSDGTTRDTALSILVKPDTTTSWTVRTLDGTSCSQNRTVTVTVRGSAVHPFGESVCAGTPAFVVDPLAGAGNWSGPGIIDAQTGRFDAALAGPGSHRLRFRPEGDCALGYQVEVVVVPAPVIDFTVDEPVGCPPHDLQFFDLSQPQAAEVLYTFGDGTIGNTFNDPLKTYFEPGWFNVTLEVYYTDFCQASATKDSFIHILLPPTAGFMWSPDRPSNLDPDVTFSDASSGEPQFWSWDFGDGGKSTEVDPVHTFSSPGVYPVTQTVAGEEGCSNSLTRDITVIWDIRLYLPTAFSPNGDGINDIWTPTVIGPLTDWHLTIHDRWGGLVFETRDPAQGWNGRSTSGDPLDPGVYVAVIEATPPGIGDQPGQLRIETAEVILVR